MISNYLFMAKNMFCKFEVILTFHHQIQKFIRVPDVMKFRLGVPEISCSRESDGG